MPIPGVCLTHGTAVMNTEKRLRPTGADIPQRQLMIAIAGCQQIR